MINRQIPPPIHLLKFPQYIHPKSFVLNNGLQVHTFHDDNQELVVSSFIFTLPAWQPENPLLYHFAATLIRNGTVSMSAEVIENALNMLGAYFDISVSGQHVILTLHCLKKHLTATWDIIYALMTNAVYPESEITQHAVKGKQQLAIAMRKNSFLARQHFDNILFGDSTFGHKFSSADYDKPVRDQLLAASAKIFNSHNCNIVLAGNLGNDIQAQCVKHFGGVWGQPVLGIEKFEPAPTHAENLTIPVADSMQCALRLGFASISRSHPDYPYLRMISIILGGYFGSRLQKNLREDKGLTYGIGSSMAAQNGFSTFYISSEVESSSRELALKEIWKEIEHLCEHEISETELSLVKNYIIGSTINNLESIFDHADDYKYLLVTGTPFTFHQYYQQCVTGATAAHLHHIARQYLLPSHIAQVAVG